MNWYKKAQLNNRKGLLEQSALKEYGETDDINKAGFILEDGTMLDFSEGSNMRVQDHRNIGSIADFGIAQEAFASSTKTMNIFMNEAGAVRVNSSPGGELSVHSNTPLSAQQISVIKQNLRNYNGIAFDICDGIDEGGSSGERLVKTVIGMQFMKGDGMRFLDNINSAFETPYKGKYDEETYDRVRDNVGDTEYSNEHIDMDYETQEKIDELLGNY